MPQSPRQGNGEGRWLAFFKGLGDCVNAKWHLLLQYIRSLQSCKTEWGVQLNRKLPMVKIELQTILTFFFKKNINNIPY